MLLDSLPTLTESLAWLRLKAGPYTALTVVVPEGNTRMDSNETVTIELTAALHDLNPVW